MTSHSTIVKDCDMVEMSGYVATLFLSDKFIHIICKICNRWFSNLVIWCPRTVSRLYQLLVTLPVFLRSQGAFKSANFGFFTLCARYHARYSTDGFQIGIYCALGQYLGNLWWPWLYFYSHRGPLNPKMYFSLCVHNSLQDILPNAFQIWTCCGLGQYPCCMNLWWPLLYFYGHRVFKIWKFCIFYMRTWQQYFPTPKVFHQWVFKLGYVVTSDGISDISFLHSEDLCSKLVWWPQPK